jgi:hypothetical protein
MVFSFNFLLPRIADMSDWVLWASVILKLAREMIQSEGQELIGFIIKEPVGELKLLGDILRLVKIFNLKKKRKKNEIPWVLGETTPEHCRILRIRFFFGLPSIFQVIGG